MLMMSLPQAARMIACREAMEGEALSKDISSEESRRIMTMATDVRPDENVHRDPTLAPPPVTRARPVTSQESRMIMALASDMRPLENVHPERDEDA
nr:hypothetical protein [Sphingomonas sp. Y57]